MQFFAQPSTPATSHAKQQTLTPYPSLSSPRSNVLFGGHASTPSAAVLKQIQLLSFENGCTQQDYLDYLKNINMSDSERMQIQAAAISAAAGKKQAIIQKKKNERKKRMLEQRLLNPYSSFFTTHSPAFHSPHMIASFSLQHRDNFLLAATSSSRSPCPPSSIPHHLTLRTNIPPPKPAYRSTHSNSGGGLFIDNAEMKQVRRAKSIDQMSKHRTQYLAEKGIEEEKDLSTPPSTAPAQIEPLSSIGEPELAGVGNGSSCQILYLTSQLNRELYEIAYKTLLQLSASTSFEVPFDMSEYLNTLTLAQHTVEFCGDYSSSPPLPFASVLRAVRIYSILAQNDKLWKPRCLVQLNSLLRVVTMCVRQSSELRWSVAFTLKHSIKRLIDIYNSVDNIQSEHEEKCKDEEDNLQALSTLAAAVSSASANQPAPASSLSPPPLKSSNDSMKKELVRLIEVCLTAKVYIIQLLDLLLKDHASSSLVNKSFSLPALVSQCVGSGIVIILSNNIRSNLINVNPSLHELTIELLRVSLSLSSRLVHAHKQGEVVLEKVPAFMDDVIIQLELFSRDQQIQQHGLDLMGELYTIKQKEGKEGEKSNGITSPRSAALSSPSSSSSSSSSALLPLRTVLDLSLDLCCESLFQHVGHLGCTNAACTYLLILFKYAHNDQAAKNKSSFLFTNQASSTPLTKTDMIKEFAPRTKREIIDYLSKKEQFIDSLITSASRLCTFASVINRIFTLLSIVWSGKEISKTSPSLMPTSAAASTIPRASVSDYFKIILNSIQLHESNLLIVENALLLLRLLTAKSLLALHVKLLLQHGGVQIIGTLLKQYNDSSSSSSVIHPHHMTHEVLSSADADTERVKKQLVQHAWILLSLITGSQKREEKEQAAPTISAIPLADPASPISPAPITSSSSSTATTESPYLLYPFVGIGFSKVDSSLACQPYQSEADSYAAPPLDAFSYFSWETILQIIPELIPIMVDTFHTSADNGIVLYTVGYILKTMLTAYNKSLKKSENKLKRLSATSASALSGVTPIKLTAEEESPIDTALQLKLLPALFSYLAANWSGSSSINSVDVVNLVYHLVLICEKGSSEVVAKCFFNIAGVAEEVCRKIEQQCADVEIVNSRQSRSESSHNQEENNDEGKEKEKEKEPVKQKEKEKSSSKRKSRVKFNVPQGLLHNLPVLNFSASFSPYSLSSFSSSSSSSSHSSLSSSSAYVIAAQSIRSKVELLLDLFAKYKPQSGRTTTRLPSYNRLAALSPRPPATPSSFK